MSNVNRRRYDMEKVNGNTFYYDPNEITLNSDIKKLLENFRSEDGEDSFALLRDDNGFIIY